MKYWVMLKIKGYRTLDNYSWGSFRLGFQVGGNVTIDKIMKLAERKAKHMVGVKFDRFKIVGIEEVKAP